MPIIRNPFRKQDENVRPATSGADGKTGTNHNATPTRPLSISNKEKKDAEPAEYKLSEINDSGVFIPPSPPERKSFWTTSSSRSTTSSNHRSLFSENEPFNISRESFDSYRRSFDISARSPVIPPAERPRASLDSRTFLPPPPMNRTSNSFHRPLQVPGTQKEEEMDAMEDVSLDDPKPAPKKRGMFSRIMDSDSQPSSHDGTSKTSSWHHFGGRKRGQSGQGAELGSIPKREDETPRPESQLQKEETVKPDSAPVKDPPKTVKPDSSPAKDPSKTTKPESTPAKDPPAAAPPPPQTASGAEKENSQAPVVNGAS